MKRFSMAACAVPIVCFAIAQPTPVFAQKQQQGFGLFGGGNSMSMGQGNKATGPTSGWGGMLGGAPKGSSPRYQTYNGDGGHQSYNPTGDIIGGIFGAIGAAAAADAARQQQPRQPRQPYYNNNNNNQPRYVQPRPVVVAPQTNTVPEVNKIVEKPITPKDNPEVGKRVVRLSSADALKMTSDLKGQSLALLNELGRQISIVTSTLIDRLPGTGNLTAEERARLLSAIESGNPAAVSNLLALADRNSAAGRDLINLATARQLSDAVRLGAAGGALNINDMMNLANAVNGTLPRAVLDAVGQMVVNQQVNLWLNGAQPQNNLIPLGGNVPIALVPGLPIGTIIPLGFGPVLVGIGNGAGNQVVLGEGNVWQCAGLAAPIGEPMPDFEGEAVAGVVLANAGFDPIKYNVNRSPYDMQPEFTQALGEGEWLVEFDRGGGKGTARYTLTDGYYAFTPTETGWELYKQEFAVTLENNNDFEFNYVVNNLASVIGPGEKMQLSDDMPIIVRFEDGEGGFVKKKLKNGDFHVALSEKVRIDVFPADAIANASKKTKDEVSVFTGLGALPLTPSNTGLAASIAGGSPAGGVAPSSGLTLPPGFRPLDPVALLLKAKDTKIAEAQKLPPAFTAFASAAPAAAAPGDGLK